MSFLLLLSYMCFVLLYFALFKQSYIFKNDLELSIILFLLSKYRDYSLSSVYLVIFFNARLKTHIQLTTFSE